MHELIDLFSLIAYEDKHESNYIKLFLLMKLFMYGIFMSVIIFFEIPF